MKGYVTTKCCKCGKEFTKVKEFYGKGNCHAKDEWEEWAQERDWLCDDCYREEQQAKRDAKAAEVAEEYGLPEIEGVSEKQIKYANDLRTQWISGNASEQWIAAPEGGGVQNVKSGREFPKILEKLRTMTSAREIIDYLK